MQSKEYIEKLVRTSILYYTAHMTQQEVAEKMGTTRQAICKYLSDAKEYGIVEIKINNPISETQELERELKTRFGLKNALVVPGNFKDESVIRHEIARIAIPHIIKMIKDGIKNIGVSWGRTVLEFINSFPEGQVFSGIELYPLMGASNNVAPYYMTNEMVRDFAEKIQGRTNFIYLPLNPGNKEDYDRYTSTQLYKRTLNNWSTIDLAIIGIGQRPNIDNMPRQSYPGELEVLTKLTSNKIVGDIFSKYYDIDGNFYSIPETELFLTIPDELFGNIKRVIALAGGADKAKSILGILRSGKITDLVTDETAASIVLNMNSHV